MYSIRVPSPYMHSGERMQHKRHEMVWVNEVNGVPTLRMFWSDTPLYATEYEEIPDVAESKHAIAFMKRRGLWDLMHIAQSHTLGLVFKTELRLKDAGHGCVPVLTVDVQERQKGYAACRIHLTFGYAVPVPRWEVLLHNSSPLRALPEDVLHNLFDEDARTHCVAFSRPAREFQPCGGWTMWQRLVRAVRDWFA
jgi:hypothetical protein